MPTDGQLISLMSHTIGSIGQVLKLEKAKQSDSKFNIDLIQRIYDGYIKQMQQWS